MAHKSMIGGAVYEVGGGKDMIGGAVYEKSHGKTMLNGAVYELGFDAGYAVVQIQHDSTHASNPDIAQIVVDGKTYNTASNAESVTVPIGTVISCTATGGHKEAPGKIYVDGTIAASGMTAQYNYVVNGNTSVTLGRSIYESDKAGRVYYGTIRITTT